MKNEMTEVKRQAVQVFSPAQLIIQAVQGNTDLDKLEKLLQLQIKWEENEAKKAFHKAMSAFKSNPPKITKNKKNNQYNSMYTTIGNLVNTVNPELSKCGLSASWDIKQNGVITVICKITHELGHFETTSMTAPADTSGSKNAIQQMKSTITYLKSVTFESICGLASTDANVDDDGQGAGTKPETKVKPLDYITNLGIKKLGDLDAFKLWRVDNNYPEDLTKATKPQLETMISVLSVMK